jgi:2-phosphoglycerate kinase
MIYLIGGAPRIGKSTIAKQFSESIKGRFVSTDKLENLRQDFLVLFYNDAKKNTLTPNGKLEVIINEASQLYPQIDDIIKKFINHHQDTVIEGVHLLPEYVANLIKTFGTKNIRSIFIGLTDIEKILQGMARNTSPNNWLKDFDIDVLRQIALLTETFSHYLHYEARKYNLLYKERSNNFQKDTLDIIKELTV